MPKTLIAVVNCRRRNEWRYIIRDTWLPMMKEEQADVRFFVGRGNPASYPSDVVELDCDDSYYGLPEKIRCIIRWAYDRGYEFMLKCDDDVVLLPRLLMVSGYDQFPYTGRANRKPTLEYPFYVPMGFNYWIDRRCMGILKDAPLPVGYDDELWVASNLYKNGILLHDDKRYRLHSGLFYENKRVNRPLRPMRDRVVDPEYLPGSFAWCVYLECGILTQSKPMVDKINEFDKVFKKYCIPTQGVSQ